MSFGGGAPGFKAIQALVAAHSDFPAIADKDWATASGLIAKKVLTSAGQSAETLRALRAACGDNIFDTQLKSLSHHQAKQLARRLDPKVADFDVSTARAAIAHVAALLAGPAAPPAEVVEAPLEPLPAETVSQDPPSEGETVGDDTPPPSSPNPYFGRKSFRTG